MTTGEVTEIGWGALRRHPRFRAAVERNAERILAHNDGLSPTIRWLANDVGRGATMVRALGLDAQGGGASVSDLLVLTRQRRTASVGRVLQLLERAEAAGLIRSAPGSAAWTQRRVFFEPHYIDRYRERVFIEIESASLVMPQIRPALAQLPDDAYFRGFLRRLHRYQFDPPRAPGPPNPSIRHFLAHDGGLKMLYDLIGRQAGDRARLLEGAPFSRSRLAARLGVSRQHVRRTFAEAAEAGHLTISSRNWVTFSEAMSREAERHFALTFYVIGTSALGAMSDLGLRSGPVSAVDAARR